MRAGQAEIFSQEVNQKRAVLHRCTDATAVYPHRYLRHTSSSYAAGFWPVCHAGCMFREAVAGAMRPPGGSAAEHQSAAAEGHIEPSGTVWQSGHDSLTPP